MNELSTQIRLRHGHGVPDEELLKYVDKVPQPGVPFTVEGNDALVWAATRSVAGDIQWAGVGVDLSSVPLPETPREPTDAEALAATLPEDGDVELVALIDIPHVAKQGRVFVIDALQARARVKDGHAAPAPRMNVKAKYAKSRLADLEEQQRRVVESGQRPKKRLADAGEAHAKARQDLKGKDPSTDAGRKAEDRVEETEKEVRRAERGVADWEDDRREDLADLAVAIVAAQVRDAREAADKHIAEENGAFDELFAQHALTAGQLSELEAKLRIAAASLARAIDEAAAQTGVVRAGGVSAPELAPALGQWDLFRHVHGVRLKRLGLKIERDTKRGCWVVTQVGRRG
jgi:hypothetical protein